jgi:hypothetical protein
MVQTIKFSQFSPINLANTTNQNVGVSAPIGGTNYQTAYPLTWDNATRPVAPKSGTLGYNTSLGQYEYWNGVAFVQLSAGGSGTVNVGSINQIAYYPANGTAVSGLPTFNNAILATNNTGVPSMQVATGTGLPVKNDSPVFIAPTLGVATATSLQFTSTAGIIGTTTNDSADAGSVGEIQPSIVPFASSIGIVSNTPINLTSLNLSAGDWDVWGNINFHSNAFSMEILNVWLSATSVTEPDASLSSTIQFPGAAFVSIYSSNAPSRPFSFNGITPIYLSCVAKFSPSTVTICGGLYARRRH